MKEPASPPNDLRLAFRIARWGGALVAAIAYAVLLPLKYQGLLPPRMTWSRVLLGPALMTLMLPTVMLISLQRGRRLWFWMAVLLATLLVLSLVLSICDPVESSAEA